MRKLLKPELFLIILIIAYVLTLSKFSIFRFITLNSHYYDLGIMNQTVYNTSQGRFLELTNPHLVKNTSRLAIHFDPILAIFAPFYKIYPGPYPLLVGQTVILALGSIAVYLIASILIRSKWLALFIGFLYLIYHPLQKTNLFDFHAVTIATTTLLYMYLFFIVKPFKNQLINTVLGIIFLMIASLTKENTTLVTFFFGIYFFIVEKHKKIPIFVMLFSLFVFGIIFFKVIPYYNQGLSLKLNYFTFQNPIELIQRLVRIDSLIYLFYLFLPVGFLPLLAPAHLLIALPEVLINLLSLNPNLRSLDFHYTALITPFVFIATIYGLQKLKTVISDNQKIFWFLILVVSIALTINFKYTPLRKIPTSFNHQQLDFIEKWQEKIKDENIIVATTGSLAPFFTQRKIFIDFFFDPAYKNTGKSDERLLKEADLYESAKYLLIYGGDIDYGNPITVAYLEHLKNNSHFRLVESIEGVDVYEKQ